MPQWSCCGNISCSRNLPLVLLKISDQSCCLIAAAAGRLYLAWLCLELRLNRSTMVQLQLLSGNLRNPVGGSNSPWRSQLCPLLKICNMLSLTSLYASVKAPVWELGGRGAIPHLYHAPCVSSCILCSLSCVSGLWLFSCVWCTKHTFIYRWRG